MSQLLNSTFEWKITAELSCTLFYRPELQGVISPCWFEPDYWLQRNAMVGTSKGRETTYFVRHQSETDGELNMVLRHYYRGGLVRRLSKDAFIFNGLDRTRSVAELKMLQHMRELDLPVPNPVAARIEKVKGLWYRNDILIETLKHTTDGFHRLKARPMSAELWYSVGATIRRFHRAGVYHSDLNIHNILIDEADKVYLIDFDRCKFRPQGRRWQDENVARLHRSLIKEQGLHADFNFTQEGWRQLMAGYHA